MNIPENVLAYFQRVDSLIAFQNIFSSHGTSITITEWLQNDLRAMQSLNMFLSYRFEAYIEPTVKQWIKAEFSSKRSKTQFNWMKELQWHVLYRSFCLASLRDIVKEKVEELCEASFDSRISGDLHDWLTQELFPFIRAFFHETDDRVCSEMHNAAIVMMVEIRSSKLFEIIADYPDSMPCLIELHDHLYSSSASCATLPSIVPMIASQLLGRIGKRLRKTIESRLLHLGAATSQILDFYVSMIAALRIVDSSDALLNYSLSPVRTYLKQRKDAIRCIISSLTESKDSDLHSALRTGMSLAYGIDEDDEEGGKTTSHSLISLFRLVAN